MNELEKTKQWFEQAIENPTVAQKVIQMGCHFEEVFEMQQCIPNMEYEHIGDIASDMKRHPNLFIHEIANIDSVELFDAILDQIVTAVGVCHMMGFDVQKGLQEVNRSNFSKFEDGNPVFDSNGKITKGKHYEPPQLDRFINGS